MANRVSDLVTGNGHVESTKQKRKPRAKRQPKVVTRARRIITVGVGCGIPVLSLALSSIGGRLCEEGHTALGAATLGICCTVLAVSLSHLAWAVRDITGSARWQSWCIAAAVDISLVLGELACVAGAGWWCISAVMAAVTATSAVLNCWAFLRHA